MNKQDLLQQIDLEMAQARQSMSFWRAQLPHHSEEPLKSAVESSLENALTAIKLLETAKDVILDA